MWTYAVQEKRVKYENVLLQDKKDLSRPCESGEEEGSWLGGSLFNDTFSATI
jgi:hypothetical protein